MEDLEAAAVESGATQLSHSDPEMCGVSKVKRAQAEDLGSHVPNAYNVQPSVE